jgi:hypothetical protein
MSYFSKDYINLLQESQLSKETPFLIQNVSHGMFSIARHYGGAKVQGQSYTYIPNSDELVRDDVLKFLKKSKKKPTSKNKASEPSLF